MFCQKTVDKVSKKDIREFLYNLKEKNKAGNTLNVHLNSLKFLFEEILGKRMKINIRYSKVPEKLPIVLSKEEIKKLFNAIENPKHKLMIQLMYSSGLRVSELINLRVEDLRLEEGYGYVRQGKGNKDRILSLQQILKKASKKARLNKKVSPHTLRHSFATHLIEHGYSLIDVQVLLGHKSPETTFSYLHSSTPKLLNIKSPLDYL